MCRLLKERPPSSPRPTDAPPRDVEAVSASAPAGAIALESAAQCLHRQRLENLGILASGTAHELKNLLTPLILAAELASLDVPSDHAVQKSLATMMTVARRARELVQRFAHYGAIGEPSCRPVALGEIAEEVLALLRPTLSKRVELRTFVASGLPLIAADALHVHQVMTNLLINAWQALEAGSGSIEVRLAPAVVDATHRGEPMNPAPGRYVRLTVRDNGVGMDDATRIRIFEEFYTTKAARQGTGRGLSIVHKIVRASGGGVIVESAPHRGSAFHIYWPVAGAAASVPFPPQS